MQRIPGGSTTAATIAELLLGGGGDPSAAAVHHDGTTIARHQLRALVAARRVELDLPGRQVVALGGRPSADWIVTYLALLEAGHVPLLVGDRRAAIAERWQPGATIEVRDGALHVERRRSADPIELHPDLALLLSTSGSTGSPKLVRLSHRNLVSNATAIAGALGLRPDDVAITSLPLHYCYGLSVLHAHLAAGASVVAIDASVVDPCFAAALDRHQVTTVAGVPHTLDLLEAAGPERIHVPSLRLLTQAGGALHPDARSRWQRRCERWGVDLVVMYGQTEATARMAILPAGELTTAPPGSVGRPVAGGSFTIRPVPAADVPGGALAVGAAEVGEVVFHGPSVMLGYALEPADLALGATTDELATGDLGRIDPTTGHLELLGRRSRFVKPFGLRIALDELERDLAVDLAPVAVTGDDEGLVVAAPGREAATVASLVAGRAGIPATAVTVLDAPELPRTSTGKLDHASLLRRARSAEAGPASTEDGRPSGVLASVLGRASIPAGRSFVAAGGDSLSYVEATMRLEQLLGQLPDDWHHLPVEELDRLVPDRPRSTLDTTVLLRAVGICTVVATHMHLAFLPGGAHLLLAVAGYNLSRFQLGLRRRRERATAALRTVGRAVVPAAAVALVVLATTDRYGWTTVAMINNYLGPRSHVQDHWHFWFIEAFAQLVLVTVALLAIPAVGRLDRRRPFLVPLLALGGAVAIRQVDWWGLDDPANLRFRTHGVAIFFVLGWLAQRADTTSKRVLATVACLAVIPGSFGMPEREWYIAGGLVLLLWAARVPLPRAAGQAASVLAAASMWILISHFHTWPVLQAHLPIGLAYPATLASGVAVAALAARSGRAWAQARVAASARAPGRPRTEPQGLVAAAA